MGKSLKCAYLKDKVSPVSKSLPLNKLVAYSLFELINFLWRPVIMAKKKELRAHIMGEDAIYVAFVTTISLGLLFLGASLAFHG